MTYSPVAEGTGGEWKKRYKKPGYYEGRVAETNASSSFLPLGLSLPAFGCRWKRNKITFSWTTKEKSAFLAKGFPFVSFHITERNMLTQV